MEALKSYLEYRKYKPEYREWKQKRDEKTSKKEKYFKANPVSEAEKKKQLEKINVVLNAVDTMDEFSQSKAENTEIATEVVRGMVSQVAGMVGFGLAAILLFSKAGGALKNRLSLKYPKLGENFEILAGGLSTIPAFIASFPMITWGAKSEIFASKIGRHEAVTTKLNSENHFAILDENQKAEIQSKMQNIEVKEDGLADKASSSFKEAFETVKNLFGQNEEVKEYIAKENKKFEANKENFTKPLSKQDIKTAKEEQEMITAIIEEVDTASQDYAEDVEFATGSLITGATAIGATAGLVINGAIKLLKKVLPENALNALKKTTSKMNKKTVACSALAVKLLPAILGFAGMLGASIAATKLQKQASRVARHTVIKGLQDNPEKLMYVDDEKLKDIEPEVKKKKENVFAFYKRLFRENKEYNEYLKENKKKNEQYRIALNEIKLSENQKADAKQLQKNVFKSFNKIDDKSQTYSENTEAFGEMVKVIGSTISVLGGLLATLFMSTKMSSKSSTKDIIKTILPTYLGLIPAIALEFFVTKEQKGATRVAHMMAIKDLEDYKHFVDYDNLKPENNKEEDGKKPAIASADTKAGSLSDNNIFSKLGFKRK